MKRILPDLLTALHDLKNKPIKEVEATLAADLSPKERHLITTQIQRLYKMLDIANQLDYGTMVEGGMVSGQRIREGTREVLIIGDHCNEWRPADQTKKTA